MWCCVSTMIIKYYGLNCDYQYLDNICFATSEGVSLNGISCAAKKIGLKSLCGTLTIKQLSKIYSLVSYIGIKIILLYFTRLIKTDIDFG